MNITTETYEIINESLYVRGKVSDKLINAFIGQKCNRLVIDPHSSNLQMLSDLGDYVFKVGITIDNIQDLSFLNNYTNLEELSSVNSIKTLVLSNYPRLNTLALRYVGFDTKDLLGCDKLRKLCLLNVNLKNGHLIKDLLNLSSVTVSSVKGFDYDVFQNLVNLERFSTQNLKLPDCQFLSNCCKLQFFTIVHSPNFLSLQGLPTQCLSYMDIVTCKNFASLHTGTQFENLEFLRIESCPKIETLYPLKHAVKLQKLLLYENTIITDGKLRELLDNLSLITFAFKNRKHYDISNTEALSILSKRNVHLPPGTP